MWWRLVTGSLLPMGIPVIERHILTLIYFHFLAFFFLAFLAVSSSTS